MLPAVPDSSRPVQRSPAAASVPSGLALVRRLADEGRWKDASRECEQVLATNELSPVAHFYQALILEQMRRLQDAEKAYRREIYLDRAFLLAHYHLALLLGKSGRHESAVQSLRTIQRLVSSMDEHQHIADADGLTVEDLRGLTNTHMELWQK